VSFTTEFKQLAGDEYCRGKSIRQIFSEAGFDVEALGDNRLQNFRNKLMEKVMEEDGFEDGRTANSRKQAQSTETQMAKRIRELEHRNAYLEQENEFLKKIQALEGVCVGKAEGRK